MKRAQMKPGTPSPLSGEVRPEYANGKLGAEVTVVKGKRLPPTRVAGAHYVVARPARNGAGKGNGK
jgi:hypothetical protein